MSLITLFRSYVRLSRVTSRMMSFFSLSDSILPPRLTKMSLTLSLYIVENGEKWVQNKIKEAQQQEELKKQQYEMNLNQIQTNTNEQKQENK